MPRSSTAVPRSAASLSVVSVTRVPRGLKISMDNSRSEQISSFPWFAVLSSVMRSHTTPLHPALDVNHPLGQHLHAAYTVPYPPPHLVT